MYSFSPNAGVYCTAHPDYYFSRLLVSLALSFLSAFFVVHFCTCRLTPSLSPFPCLVLSPSLVFWACLLVWCHAGAQSMCSNGLPGVEASSLDACCVAECGTCGGIGCTPVNSTLTSADCCATEIVDSGSLCSDTGAAPCIITTCEL